MGAGITEEMFENIIKDYIYTIYYVKVKREHFKPLFK